MIFLLFPFIAIQLDYSEAHKHLVQSLRKAPSSAIGFRHTVHKLSTVVQLLLGNIPERQLFLQPANKEALAPYFELTKGKERVHQIVLDILSSNDRFIPGYANKENSIS